MMTDFKIRDEEKLILQLCRLEFTPEQLGKIKLMISVITEWNYFRNLASEHGVAALVWHNLERYQLNSGIPGNVIDSLRIASLWSLSRNTFNTQSMGEVLRLLNTADIKTVILKGLALENSVYGNSGLRQMSDVDILINRENCIKARDILMRNGYVSLPVKSVFHEMIMTHWGKHLPSLIKNGTSVEIHHSLFGGKNDMLTAMLYNTGYEVEIKGERAWFPQPQIFFLYLVKHLYKHEMNNESQLRLYTDLVVMIEKYKDEILNDKLLKYADEAGISEILAWHLEPLRDLWSVTFPEKINNFIDQWHNEDYIKKFFFFLGSPKCNPPGDKPEFYRHVISEVPGFHRKVLYILGDIFPSLQFMKNRYKCRSSWRALFYYPHRLGKVFWLFRR